LELTENFPAATPGTPDHTGQAYGVLHCALPAENLPGTPHWPEPRLAGTLSTDPATG